MANSDDIKAGQVVYALGSPVGLQNTISDGISYEEFYSNNNVFTLLVEPEIIELEVGESKEIFVYAEGKGCMYIYPCYSINEVESYSEFLLNNGFVYYDERREINSTSYSYLTPEYGLIDVTLSYLWNEVWIIIPY